jgi:hypothetical protein
VPAAPCKRRVVGVAYLATAWISVNEQRTLLISTTYRPLECVSESVVGKWEFWESDLQWSQMESANFVLWEKVDQPFEVKEIFVNDL